MRGACPPRASIGATRTRLTQLLHFEEEEKGGDQADDEPRGRSAQWEMGRSDETPLPKQWGSRFVLLHKELLRAPSPGERGSHGETNPPGCALHTDLNRDTRAFSNSSSIHHLLPTAQAMTSSGVPAGPNTR